MTDALRHFERLVKLTKVGTIKSQTIDRFISKRRAERGRTKNITVSPATVNKELRYLKAVLRVARDWGYLPQVGVNFRLQIDRDR